MRIWLFMVDIDKVPFGALGYGTRYADFSRIPKTGETFQTGSGHHRSSSPAVIVRPARSRVAARWRVTVVTEIGAARFDHSLRM